MQHSTSERETEDCKEQENVASEQVEDQEMDDATIKQGVMEGVQTDIYLSSTALSKDNDDEIKCQMIMQQRAPWVNK